eukprot:102345_1
MLAKPKKKMKKLLTNKRKGYSKLAVQQDTNKHSFSKQYEAEDLEMDLDISYGLNRSLAYNTSQLRSTTSNALGTTVPTAASMPLANTTSITQTYIDDFLDQGISKKTEFCVVPFYLMILIMSLITTALLSIHEISETLGMAVLSGFTILGAMIGMYGIYAWGVFDDVLLYLKRQNQRYRMSIDRLNSMGEVLQNDVDDINQSVDYLKRDGNALEKAMSAYDELRKELQAIGDKMDEHKDGHEDIMDLVKDFEEQCTALTTIIEDNEKAHLLSIFYSVKLYDYGINHCLDRKQYKRFLCHCGKQTRERFEKEGGFDAMDR